MSAAARIAQGFNFGVRFPRTMMPATANDRSVFDEDRADHWVGGGESKRALRQAHGQAHIVDVRWHTRRALAPKHGPGKLSRDKGLQVVGLLT